MIEQCLPQTNESATVAKSKNISHLNKALLSHSHRAAAAAAGQSAVLRNSLAAS